MKCRRNPRRSVQPVRAMPVGNGLKLWVFVYPSHKPGHTRGGGGGGRGGGDATEVCTDVNTQTGYALFAKAKPAGLTLNINDGSIPINNASAKAAIHSAFGTWDDEVAGSYFTVNDSGGASGPALDGNNTVGWAFLVPPSTLAATWVWTDANDRVVEADIFYNNKHNWGVLTECGGKLYDVEAVGAHEISHALAIAHTSDDEKQATMYPSAGKGEVHKSTLTVGDASALTASLAP